MRGIMMVALLIVALIIGILVVQDMQTEDATGTKNIERVDRAKESAKNANKAIDRIKNTAKEAGTPQDRSATQEESE
jgi:riboflavin synthase